MRAGLIVGAAGSALLVTAVVASFPGRTAVTVLGAAAITWMLVRIDKLDRSTAREMRTLQQERDDLATEFAAERSMQSVLLDSLQVGIAAFRGGRLVFANRDARAELGLAQGGSTTMPLPPAVRSVLDGAQAGEGTVSEQYQSGYPVRTTEVVATPVVDSDLVVVRFVDVTERLLTDRMRRDFVAAASHELKTPAAAIQAAAETVLVALDDDPEVARDFATRVHQQSTRLSRIVSDLLDLSRLDTSGTEHDSVDLGVVVNDEIARLGPTSRTVIVDAPDTVVSGSVPDLALAVRNLLDNALRYTASDGTIRVEIARAPGDTVVLSVSDDGAGIPADDLPRIFERFYRVDEGRSRATGGTGLGLAIVKHVAEQHGGSVTVESNLGAGSTFRLRLPDVAGRR